MQDNFRGISGEKFGVGISESCFLITVIAKIGLKRIDKRGKTPDIVNFYQIA